MLYRGLDHFKADRGDLLQPLPRFAAFKVRISGNPGAQQGDRESHRRAGASGLEPEHLAIDLVLQMLAPELRNGASLVRHFRLT